MNARRHLTIRNVSPALAEALESEKTRRGTSLNQTVLDLLASSLGVEGEPRTNGLATLAGGWGPGDAEEFLQATEWTRIVDPEVWR